MKKLFVKKNIPKFFIILFLSILVAFFLIPYFWMLSNSFKGMKELLMNPRNLLPQTWTISGYVKVLTKAPFFKWFGNSCIVAITDTTVIVLDSALIGYVFSQYRFRGKGILFMVILATMMIPSQTTMIPSFILIDSLGLYDKLAALIIPTFVNVFGIYLCKQFCDEIPSELMESAKIDGAGDMTVFIKIVIPQIRPAMGSLAIFTFLEVWNEYVQPLIMLSSTERMTLPLALSYFSGMHGTDLSATLAASVLTMIPVTVVFLLFQKQFVKGIAMTGMK